MEISDIILRVENLNYSYDGVHKVLEDVSFTILRGEVTTILGPNGAGKTTILKCILRALKPRGAIYIDGKEVNKITSRELAKIIGYVPHRHHSVFAYKVIDFVLMGRAPHHSMFSLPSRKEYERALEILEELGIKDLADRTIAEVSGGQLQLVLIARALVQEAKILLLDEPTAHLDIANELKVLNIIKSLVKKRKIEAAIMTLHDPLMASLFSDKIVLLNKGKVIAYGSPSTVLTPRNLNMVYGVEFETIVKDEHTIVLPKIPAINL